MSNIRVETAAATAVVNYDLIQSELLAAQPKARVIKGIALVGSAAAGDTIVELMVNGRSIGKFENSATGTAIDNKRDLRYMREYVPANGRVQVFVRDAPATNPICCFIQFDPVAGRAYKAGGKKTYSAARRRVVRMPGGMY